jgi:hypothetical protein
MAETITEDDWKARHWFGSVATLVAASEQAEAELAEIDPVPVGPEVVAGVTHWTHASVRYQGGTFKADNLAEVREALPEIERRGGEIESISLVVATPRFQASVSADVLRGVSASVEGPKATVVHGLVSTLQRKLEPGVGRVRKPPKRPPELEHFLWLMGGWLIALVVIGLGVWSTLEYSPGFDFGFFFLGLIAGGTAYVGTDVFIDRGYPQPPALQLVPASEEDAPAPEPDNRGPVLKGRDWLRRHPLLTLLGVVVVGVASNLISGAISS